MMNNEYKPYGMTVALYYKNSQYKQYFNVICFNLVRGEILIWLYGKTRPIVRKLEYIIEFYCEYTRY